VRGTDDGLPSRYVISIEVAAGENVASIGGKCADLATLAMANPPVSAGIAATTEAYMDMLAVDRLGKEIDLHLYIPEFARVAVDEFVSLYRQAAG